MKCLSYLVAGLATAAALDRTLWGINYDTRTSEWGGCKDPSVIAADLTALKTVTNIVRLYSMKQPCADRVLKAAKNLGLKVWIGTWSEVASPKVTDSFDADFKILQSLVKNGAITNDNIAGIQVSSEALFRYYINGGAGVNDTTNPNGINAMVAHLNQTRSYLRDNKLDFPVTIADVMDIYNNYPQLYNAVDIVSVNQFSMWENVEAANGAFTMWEHWQKIQQQARAAGKPILMSETGWSSDGTNPAIKEASPEAERIFTTDFLRVAEQMQMNYFYFASFDLSFSNNTIEKNFGIFAVNRTMKPCITQANVGPAPTAVRLFLGDKVLKADGYLSNTYTRLTMDKPSTGTSSVLDNEIWFYDNATQTLRSKSANQCLDSYGSKDWQNVHLWKCDYTNKNQKWKLANNAVAVQNGANFCMDSDPTMKYDDGMQKVQMWWCWNGPNQKITMRPINQEPVQIKNGKAWLTSSSNVITTSTTQATDSQTFFYDPIAQTIATKAKTCLDLTTYARGTKITARTCSGSPTQKWQYNDVTGQINHGTSLALCLSASSTNDAVVQLCDKSDTNQKWSMDLSNPSS
ncbi:glycoside hydrolase [Thraustotheca clavata]|uniref:glucan endo-1,3-beta-D-glucosidase n=1 Tax=Thraustotheca clavata TaxID=74557 RepID=A0A0A7CM53_9STRA|nr:secreted protein [Thraustotheca clavata]OQS02653.1 glycoside hydrolase [Thraustotheca clavata]